MKSCSHKLLGGIAALLVASTTLADQSWVEISDGYTMQVLQSAAQFSPENMTGLGVRGFEADVVDLRPNRYERERDAINAQITNLEAALETTEHPKVRQDLEILIRALREQNESAAINRRYLLGYPNLPGLFYNGFSSLLDPRLPPERYPDALTRLKRYTGQAEGYTPIVDLARARVSERFSESGLVGPYRGEIEDDIQNAPLAMAGLRDLFTNAGLVGWEADLDLLDQQVAEYVEWLRQELLPRAREDYRLPEAVYANNVRGYGVVMDPRELIQVAQTGFGEIQNEMKGIARQIAEQRGMESADYRDVMAVLKADQVAQEDLLPLYQERMALIEEMIIEHEVITLPERDAVVRLATEAEAGAAPASFLNPPPLVGNTGQPAEFVLVTSDPNADEGIGAMDDWTHDGITWTLAIHEARPGHELQFSSMIEGGVSQARAIYAFNSANTEGWALYAEAIMKPYLPLEGQLFSLQARLARAARAFLDPMLNLGLIDADSALAFLMKDVGLSQAMAGSEVSRYTFRAPGQATSYYYGYLNMMRLRTETEIAMRDRFVEKDFHDFVLAQGLLPAELLREAVQEEYVTR